MDNDIENIVENFDFNKVKDADAAKMGSSILFDMTCEQTLQKMADSFFDFEFNTGAHIRIFRDMDFDNVDIASNNVIKFKDDCSGRSMLAKIENDNTLTFYPKTSKLVVILPWHNNFEDFKKFLKTWGFDGYKIKTDILEIEFGWDKPEFSRKYEDIINCLEYVKDYNVLNIHEITFDTYEDYLKTKEIGKKQGKQVIITYTSKNDTNSVRIKQI